MSLDPQVAAFLERRAGQQIPALSALSPRDAREAIVAEAAMLGPAESVHTVDDRTVPGPGGPIPIRIYRPLPADRLPVLVYFHGGGWVLGDIPTHDKICCTLANASGWIVISVDYRLAPEHKFPAAANDAYAATIWVAENSASFGGDPGRVAVAGDSAGGNLAAVVCLMARDRGRRQPVLQVLIYPITDFRFDTLSYRENAEGYLLTRADMQWFWANYVSSPQEAIGPYASPLRADDLRGLAPALVITAEYDPLRDEGEEYADRLREAGVPVTLTRYDGMIHAFFRRTDEFDQARAAVRQVVSALTECS